MPLDMDLMLMPASVRGLPAAALLSAVQELGTEPAGAALGLPEVLE
jgi:hypothetical protein